MEDKVSSFLNKNKSDKCFTHSYQLIYDTLLGSFPRDTELDILEVGVEKGGSLSAWKEYFPQANVIGVDIKDTREIINNETTFVLSDIKKYKPNKQFDIIIDDGSHSNSDGLWSIENMSSWLKDNGTLVIEDVQEGFMLPFLAWGKLNGRYILSAIDMRRVTNAHDNFVILIQKYE